MPQFDMPLDQLRTFAPEIPEAADFDDFWRETLGADGEVTYSAEPFDNRQALVDTWDITFAGAGGTPVKAWLHVPAGATGPLPAVIRYIGYSGSRGMPTNNNFATAGYAEFVLDTRGQGWSGNNLFGGTADASPDAGTFGPPGPMTSGITDPQTYYYRRLITDAVRLMQLAAGHPLVDARRIFTLGVSQGGYLTIAAAGLAPSVGIDLAGALPDVAFMCAIPRAVDIAVRGPFPDVAKLLMAAPHVTDDVWRTMTYFDGVSFAKRATAPALFSVALADDICPASTVFAAFNQYAGQDKDIEVYPYNNHEGGQEAHVWKQLGWIADRV